MVSTHSHPKVAADIPSNAFKVMFVSTHSHPKVAALNTDIPTALVSVSTHSHPKVAAGTGKDIYRHTNGFNTQPPEGGC